MSIILQTTDSKLHVQEGPFRFTFLRSGDLYEAAYGEHTLINQLLANPLDGALSNLFLRRFAADGIEAVPLLGVRSASRLRRHARALAWEGEAWGAAYRVTFRLTEQGVWFWDVALSGNAGLELDVIYGQDVGLADRGAVRSNEAYVSQYIGHSVFRHPAKGYVVCSRQNQPQGGKFPYLQQGALTGAAGYSTDGFQFFGLSYKDTDVPVRLAMPSLANEIYQYEFAYVALQSERIRLNGEARVVFYGLLRADHPEAADALAFGADVAEAWRQTGDRPLGPGEDVEAAKRKASIASPLRALPLTDAELAGLYPERLQEEYGGGELLSFFTPGREHVVLKEKELRVERPHGHILMTGGNDRVRDEVLTTTVYMYGVFNSQLAVGNTTFHKLLSNTRSALNVMKASGQRIYVELEGRYRLLALPSLFEMGFNYARWRYKLADDVILVTCFASADTPEVCLRFESESGIAYPCLVTNQAIMNANEYELPASVAQEGDTLTFRAAAGALSASAYPELRYRLRVTGAVMNVGDERLLADDAQPGEASLAVLALSASPSWSLTVQGLLHGQPLPFAERSADEEKERYRAFLGRVLNGFRLSSDGGASAEVESMNTLAWWYAHNMLVHFSAPHGLEQYGGAAWGTRDVCQGPAEYFLAAHRYGTVREILLRVYAQQYEDTGHWPQWFMFDRYAGIRADESHGDIVVWPLKVLGDYLRATGDFGILAEPVPYMARGPFAFTKADASLLAHVRKEIAYIRGHFVHGTHLSAYGDGDWDDTLQPANAMLKRYMVSSWTVALTYQAIGGFAAAIKPHDAGLSAELQALAEGIRLDFNRYMLAKDVIPGFLYMEDPSTPEPMLHPEDTATGIRYRLLPMTRSMIGELLTKEQAEAHYALIKEKLYFPDGVRLMDRPARYAGGVSKRFKRAEQAANFGREIGLQYVHAHIRFVEASAKLGYGDEAWKALLMINPVSLSGVVPNAEPRQRNAYFSSSDGKFNDRYAAQEGFEGLRDGRVPVKGGWRIYSSGPGIYMNQLVSNCLGIRQEEGDLVVDPVLPDALNGLRFAYRFMDRPVEFVYRLGNAGERKIAVNGTELSAAPTANRYRRGGLRVARELLVHALREEGNVIELWM
ncbi:Cellobiose phosphorylase [Paenibacillus sp. UNC496MF]|uniref:GH36-type glycosyl hydrolase domain-containing protein n=1 Tax=Paenibacillus sp. UNC496MF TaxID=1502753 RepID=UPI0008EF7B5E|nr:cellobiose phosphorylase [Paenibacillus sp. UNC496MF]SFJ69553.1 Cellobiose phosphorylase [Paenibacillus sp. UNC496MF]